MEDNATDIPSEVKHGTCHRTPPRWALLRDYPDLMRLLRQTSSPKRTRRMSQWRPDNSNVPNLTNTNHFQNQILLPNRHVMLTFQSGEHATFCDSR